MYIHEVGDFVNHSVSPSQNLPFTLYPQPLRYREINGNGIYTRNIYFANVTGLFYPMRKGRSMIGKGGFVLLKTP